MFSDTYSKTINAIMISTIFRTFFFSVISFYSVSHFAFAQNRSTKLTSYVNPFIGTGALTNSLAGCTYPGATVPFGMVQLSPDTREDPGWTATSGYDHNDNTIVGFSHTHMSGTGVADLFDILFMPTTGEIKTRPGDASKPGSGYRSRFSHSQEEARPGYYQAKLLDYNINAELTATEHGGMHRYSFLNSESNHLVVDLNHAATWRKVVSSQFRVVNDHAIEGYRLVTGWVKLRRVYFYAEFSSRIQKAHLYDGDNQYSDETINGTDLRAVLDFESKSSSPLIVKVGLSTVSAQNAKLNLEREIPGWDFDLVSQNADLAWEKELNKIQVSGSEHKKQIFYTGLYHALLQPNNLADVNGEYAAVNSSIKKANDNSHYSTFSLWDTYRATHPLYTLIEPDKNIKFVNNLIRQYDDYGYLPIWQLWGQENYCMIGNHAIPVIVDAVMKDMPGIDVQKAYEAIRNSSLRSHINAPFSTWEKYHYMPENLQSQSVSLTLEMSYDDWCVAQLAKKLGKIEDYERFSKRSQYYQNLYDKKINFFRAKSDAGKFIEPFSPIKYGANGGNPFTEGNAWQYYWYVPHDVYDLIKLTGGDRAFGAKLDTFFTLNAKPSEVNGNVSGFIGQYAHGNEPSHHVAYLYNYVGQPWKTQFYVAKIINELYTNDFAGYVGNEDCGQMSSWYIFSSMGFYPVNPANGIYSIGSPAFDEAKIQLSNGNTFIIKASSLSKDNIYIQSALLNGKPYFHTFLLHKDIEQGGELSFIMGPKPNRNWGTRKGDRPGITAY
ncbi:GH92 family glycosyl hydrolase [Desertivirga xinjiangensis]|uniref:GH92 family glycosyl hydrolase n=1 Tax=Desertivirga xinjiangensis TaxID=539206 RepID=UPI00210922E1|nr:GH92 family glycosyl hydrolase [Pedobacter xinjiangensis]